MVRQPPRNPLLRFLTSHTTWEGVLIGVIAAMVWSGSVWIAKSVGLVIVNGPRDLVAISIPGVAVTAIAFAFIWIADEAWPAFISILATIAASAVILFLFNLVSQAHVQLLP